METDAYKATTTAETTTTSRQEGPGMGLDREFFRTVMGILLIAASVSGLLLSICGSVFPWSHIGGGFVAFVGWAAFIGTAILFFLYLFRVLPRVPGPFGLVILIYLAVIMAFSVIAFIVSAVKSDGRGPGRNTVIIGLAGPAIASAVFSLITMGLHTALGFLLFRKWRQLSHAFHRGECGHSYSVASTQQAQGGPASAQQPTDPPPAYGNY